MCANRFGNPINTSDNSVVTQNPERSACFSESPKDNYRLDISKSTIRFNRNGFPVNSGETNFNSDSNFPTNIQSVTRNSTNFPPTIQSPQNGGYFPETMQPVKQEKDNVFAKMTHDFNNKYTEEMMNSIQQEKTLHALCEKLIEGKSKIINSNDVFEGTKILAIETAKKVVSGKISSVDDLNKEQKAALAAGFGILADTVRSVVLRNGTLATHTFSYGETAILPQQVGNSILNNKFLLEPNEFPIANGKPVVDFNFANR
jgi:hypothetical protein